MLTTEQEVNIKKLAAMIRGIKVAMITTTGRDGILRCRPMATQEADFDGSLWFLTQAGSEKPSEIRQNPQVNASYVAVEEHHYVSLRGVPVCSRIGKRWKSFGDPLTVRGFPRGSTTLNFRS
jgi:general stress protein 26